MEKHKKVTARKIVVSKLNAGDPKNVRSFEDRIPLERKVNLAFADSGGDELFSEKGSSGI